MSFERDSRKFGPLGVAPAPAAAQWEVVHIDDGAVVAVAGEMDMDNAPDLLRDVLATLELPVSSITIDLAQVTYVDSSGLGTLVAAHYRAMQQGTTFKLLGVTEQTRRIFEITDLAEMFGLTD